MLHAAASCLFLLFAAPVALSAVTCPAPTPARWAPLWGPPTICHPIDIGDAQSLPWKDGAFTPDEKYDVSHVVADTLALLDGSGDTLVHMETLRRAVIYLTNEGVRDSRGTKGARTQDIALLLQKLQERAEWEAARGAPAAPPVAPAPKGILVVPTTAPASALPPRVGGPGCARAASGCDAGLCWFDVGYARAALVQLGVSTGPAAGSASAAQAFRSALDQAATLRPQDGALQLGIALALFGGEAGDEAASMEHLDKSLSLADDSQGLLRRNQLGTLGKFLGARTHEDLVAAVRERRQRA